MDEEKLKALAEQFFVKTQNMPAHWQLYDQRTFFVPNQTLIPAALPYEVDGVKLLVEILRRWVGVARVFNWDNCFSGVGSEKRCQLVENEWAFFYQTTPGVDERDNSHQRSVWLLDHIFGDWLIFDSLPFVEIHGSGARSFKFSDLINFVDPANRSNGGLPLHHGKAIDFF